MFARIFGISLAILTAAATGEEPSIRPATRPSSLLPPMHFDHTAPQQAFERLARESGVSLSVSPGTPAVFWSAHADPITCDLTPMSYWEALHRLCVTAKITARASTDEQIVVAESTPPPGRQFAFVHGLATFQLDSMRVTGQMFTSKTPVVQSDCRISFRAAIKPELRPVRSDPIKITALTDQSGNPIEVKSRFPAACSDNGALLTEIVVDRGPAVTKIGRIAGELTVNLQGEPQTLEIDDIIKTDRVVRTIAGIQFEVTPHYATNVCDVEINVTNKDRADWLQFSKNLTSNYPQLLDAKGGKYQMANGSSQGGSRFHLTVHYRQPFGNAAPVGEPKKLIWRFTTAGRAITIPFEFKDVPLEQAMPE